MTILNKGKRCLEFADGQKIYFDFPSDYYSGTFLGALKLETYGKINFLDQANAIKCEVVIGKVKKRPTDYLEGTIYKGS